MQKRKRPTSFLGFGTAPKTSVELEQQQADPTVRRAAALKSRFDSIAAANAERRSRAEQAATERRTSGAVRIAAVRERCTETLFAAIEAAIEKNGWKREDVESGLAYERCYAGLTGQEV